MRSPFLVAVLAAFAVLPFASNASASDDVEPPRRWYGWQTLGAYGTADPMLAFALPRLERGDGASVGLAMGSLTIHLLSGPTVHFVHGNVRRGFGSLGMNFLMMGVGAGLGMVTVAVAVGSSPPCGVFNDFCKPDRTSDAILEGAVIGGAIGVAVANIIDVSALAYDHPRSKKIVPSAKTPAVVLGVAPLLAPNTRGLALTGVF